MPQTSWACAWEGDSVLFWIVTLVTRGRAIESALAMTQVAFFLCVILVKRLPGNSMVKRRRAPGVMAVIAVVAQPFKGHLSVAVATALVLVEPSERPARATMVKRIGVSLAFGPVTALASAGRPGSQIHIALVTPDTRPMGVSGLARLRLLLVARVAARTT